MVFIGIREVEMRAGKSFFRGETDLLGSFSFLLFHWVLDFLLFHQSSWAESLLTYSDTVLKTGKFPDEKPKYKFLQATAMVKLFWTSVPYYPFVYEFQSILLYYVVTKQLLKIFVNLMNLHRVHKNETREININFI